VAKGASRSGDDGIATGERGAASCGNSGMMARDFYQQLATSDDTASDPVELDGCLLIFDEVEG